MTFAVHLIRQYKAFKGEDIFILFLMFLYLYFCFCFILCIVFTLDILVILTESKHISFFLSYIDKTNVLFCFVSFCPSRSRLVSDILVSLTESKHLSFFLTLTKQMFCFNLFCFLFYFVPRGLGYIDRNQTLEPLLQLHIIDNNNNDDNNNNNNNFWIFLFLPFWWA